MLNFVRNYETINERSSEFVMIMLSFLLKFSNFYYFFFIFRKKKNRAISTPQEFSRSISVPADRLVHKSNTHVATSPQGSSGTAATNSGIPSSPDER